jgi:hypothetical protein
MLDDRIQYAQMAAEDRLRQAREQAALGRGGKRIFVLAGRRSERSASAR